MREGAGGQGDAAGDVGGVRAEAGGGAEPSRFRVTLVRVLLVQFVTLALLWFLQAAYHR
ncbi:MAG: hypothetical protein OXQ94_01365 [Gemmatimonadota bacterium]|nr:hypothetical protein [Gemmatimonadota bacterium]